MKTTHLFEPLVEAKVAKTEEDVNKWFEDNRIHHGGLTVGGDGKVDIQGDIIIAGHQELNQLGIRFGTVSGSFKLAHNGLRTLAGCPHLIEKDAHFSGLDIKSFQGSGLYGVGGNLKITATRIKNLEGLPDHVHGELVIYANNELVSLKGIPTTVDGDVTINNNNLLPKIDALPEVVGGILNICDRDSKKPFTSLKGIHRMVKKCAHIKIGPIMSDIMGLCSIEGLKTVEISWVRNTPTGFDEKKLKQAIEIIRPFFGKGNDRKEMMDLQEKLAEADLDDYAAM